MPRFVIRKEGEIQSSLDLQGEDFMIGRLPGVDIQLDHPAVSRRHARVRRKEADWVVEDCASLNGFAVSGRQLRQHVLSDGDEIQIESFGVVFQPSEALFQDGLRAARRSSSGESMLDRTMTHESINAADLLRRPEE